MMTILVSPPELHKTSFQLMMGAKKIAAALNAIDNDMNDLKGHVFLGNRADDLQISYILKRESLIKAKEIVAAFANDLQNVATVFENADRGQVDFMLPLSSGGFWKNIQIIPALPIWPAQPTLPIAPWENIKLPIWLDNLIRRFFSSESSTPTPFEVEKPEIGFGELLQKSMKDAQETTSPSPHSIASEAKYLVPTRSQGDLYGNAGCAPTSISMVLDYYNSINHDNKTISPDELINIMDAGDGVKGKGISPSNLTDELNQLGYQNIAQKVGAQYSDLETALDQGPVIVTAGVKIVGPGTIWTDTPRAINGPGNTIHAMVVTGLGESNVVVNDPWTGRELLFSKEEFSTMWDKGSKGIYVIRP